ncbi:arabinosyltransferase ARAD1 [Spatholobus suberectus]|nr:arabinosyltransferase ARAD1 [Spatholobus suberectus]
MESNATASPPPASLHSHAPDRSPSPRGCHLLLHETPLPCTISPNVVHVSQPQFRRGESQLSLKIYVYEPDEINGLEELMRGRDGKISEEACLKGQWGTQVKIHKLLLQSKQRTRKKEEADLFFVPSYVKCARMMGGLNDKEINHTYVKVISQMPYFRLSGGRNHIFVFPSGAGAHLFKSWGSVYKPLHYSYPGGNIDDGMTRTVATVVQPLPLSKRKYLANYLGRAQGKAGRLKLIELAKQFPEKLECPDLKFSGPDKLGRKEYFEHLRNSKFCLAPRGESSWTLRFYESFFVECVPVILSDQIELPFQNVIDYSQISIKWPSSRIGPELLQYLESIPGRNTPLSSTNNTLLAYFSFKSN